MAEPAPDPPSSLMEDVDFFMKENLRTPVDPVELERAAMERSPITIAVVSTAHPVRVLRDVIVVRVGDRDLTVRLPDGTEQAVHISELTDLAGYQRHRRLLSRIGSMFDAFSAPTTPG